MYLKLSTRGISYRTPFLQSLAFKCDGIYSPQSTRKVCVCVSEWVSEWVRESVSHMIIYGQVYITWSGHVQAMTHLPTVPITLLRSKCYCISSTSSSPRTDRIFIVYVWKETYFCYSLKWRELWKAEVILDTICMWNLSATLLFQSPFSLLVQMCFNRMSLYNCEVQGVAPVW